MSIVCRGILLTIGLPPNLALPVAYSIVDRHNKEVASLMNQWTHIRQSGEV